MRVERAAIARNFQSGPIIPQPGAKKQLLFSRGFAAAKTSFSLTPGGNTAKK